MFDNYHQLPCTRALHQDQRENGRLAASQDWTAGNTMVIEGTLIATDWLPEGADPFTDGYRDRIYSLMGRP